MTKIHFEIGHVKNRFIPVGRQETESVFRANTLSECIEEFKKQKYNMRHYFIDVWETKKNDVPYPIADIKLSKWIFQ